MKYISTIFSAAALVLVGVIYFVQHREIGQLKKQAEGARTVSGPAGPNFKIAYFDLDTLQEKYDFMKDVRHQPIDGENQMNQDRASRDRKNQQQIETWR